MVDLLARLADSKCDDHARRRERVRVHDGGLPGDPEAVTDTRSAAGFPTTEDATAEKLAALGESVEAGDGFR